MTLRHLFPSFNPLTFKDNNLGFIKNRKTPHLNFALARTAIFRITIEIEHNNLFNSLLPLLVGLELEAHSSRPTLQTPHTINPHNGGSPSPFARPNLKLLSLYNQDLHSHQGDNSSKAHIKWVPPKSTIPVQSKANYSILHNTNHAQQK